MKALKLILFFLFLSVFAFGQSSLYTKKLGVSKLPGRYQVMIKGQLQLDTINAKTSDTILVVSEHGVVGYILKADLVASVIDSSLWREWVEGKIAQKDLTTNVGIGLADPNQKLQVDGNINTTLNDVYMINDTTVARRVGINYFYGAGPVGLTSGCGNIAMGFHSGRAITSGNYNTLGGTWAGGSFLGGVSTGHSNAVWGAFSMGYTNGSFNSICGDSTMIAFGTNSSNNAFLGYGIAPVGVNLHQNTIIGARAGALINGQSGNVFLGYGSGAQETGSNKLYIDNSNTASPLIWGDFNTNLFKVNGTFILNRATARNIDTFAIISNDTMYKRYINLTTGVGLLPSGTSGQTLRSNGSSWVANSVLYNDGTNVGIGTTNPLQKLHVIGSVRIPWYRSYMIGDTAMVRRLNENTMFGTNPLSITGNNNTFTGFNSGVSTTSGQNNTFIGKDAGYSNTTGQSNTFIGKEAGYSNTSGKMNTALGDSALRANTTGLYNTALGYQTLAKNTGNYNTAVGNNSMGNSTVSGYYNTSLGSYAAGALTSGNYNVSIGYSSMANSNITGNNNIAIGCNSNFNNTSGMSNTAIGTKALYSNTSGKLNTAVGDSAGYANTIAIGVTAIGYQALASNTTSTGNTATGFQAGLNTTGQNNTFNGYQAGYSNTTGQSNTFLGKEAGYSNTSGTLNVAIGDSALRNCTNRRGNTAVGYKSLALTSGTYNTALGYMSGYNTGSGWNNTFVGYTTGYVNTGERNSFYGSEAGYANSTGQNNSAYGYRSFYTTNTGQGNSSYGAYSLYSNTSGKLNTAVGDSAGFANTTGYSNLFLGYQAGAANTTGSNQLWIANTSAKTLVWGDFTNNRLGVGLMTAIPEATLHVRGYGTTDTVFMCRNNKNRALSDSSAYILKNGNMGIGTAAPGTKLEVNGSIKMGGTGMFANSATGTNSAAFGISNIASGNYSVALGVSDTASGVSAFAAGTNSRAGGNYAIALGTGSRAMGEQSHAIGTDVHTAGSYSKAIGARIMVNGIGSIGIGLNPNRPLKDNITGDSIMAIMGGKVGIGTTAPAAKLDVRGGVRYGGVNAYATADSVSPLRLYGDATVWEEDFQSAESVYIPSEYPDIVWNPDSGMISAAADADTTTMANAFKLNYQLPNSWKEGSDVKLKIPYFMPLHGEDGTYKFVVYYRWRNPCSFNTGWIHLNSDTTCTQGSYFPQVSITKAISGSGKTIGSLLQFAVFFYEPSEVNPALIQGFSLLYEKDAIGAKEYNTK